MLMTKSCKYQMLYMAWLNNHLIQLCFPKALHYITWAQ